MDLLKELDSKDWSPLALSLHSPDSFTVPNEVKVEDSKDLMFFSCSSENFDQYNL